MQKYNPKKIEAKWQKKWYGSDVFEAKNGSKKPKFYVLVEFPYPSGDGLHVGHCRSYTALDIIARKRRMQGQNVLYPIGWDAFGLPTENYAIKMGLQPAVVTKKNTDNFRKQMKSLGLSFDFSREINTTDPKYYKWTQWIFLQLFKHGLAYKEKIAINWCPSCKIGLANEEVVAGKCERCGTVVEKREKEQWLIKITKYAERLIKDLDNVDYLEKIKIQQKEWIGKKEGAEIDFSVAGFLEKIKVFTTRPDTLFGCTFMVLAPEHLVIEKIKDKIKNWQEVEKYINEAKNKSDLERQELKEKTGIELKGIKAINPANKKEIPIFVADYVMINYGTGAIMAVPAHDERDFEFAKKYNLPIKQVIMPVFGEKIEGEKERNAVTAFVRRPSDNKYLFIYAKAFKEFSKVYGGLENGENLEQAAVREVFEETGYKTKFIREIGLKTEAHFYHPHKKENRKLLCDLVELELIDEKQYDISEEEKSLHDVFWFTLEEAKKKVSSQGEVFDFNYFTSQRSYLGKGVLMNSDRFNGLEDEKAKWEITKFVGGKKSVNYKLRDWVFSRQHYWGEPIPLIFCEKCGWQSVPEKDLPVELPKVKNYKPTNTGESPLASIEKWVNTKCPKCKGSAKRETDTMPNWAGSNWYYLAYLTANNRGNSKFEIRNSKLTEYWMPVDWYNGGMEHTTLHLLYSRFIFKFLWDIGAVPKQIGSEPYKKRTSHGMVLGEGGIKMSKSKGNVINPDDVVKQFGADTLRIYEMFMGPFDQMIPWDTKGVVGVRRFLEKVYNLANDQLSNSRELDNKNLRSLLHKTIKKVGEDIEQMKFNTAVSCLMEFVNAWNVSKNGEPASAHSFGLAKKDFADFLKILSPFAPHLAEELWTGAKFKGMCCQQTWPKFDEKLIKEKKVLLIVQINGKVRDKIEVDAGLSQKEAEKLIFESEKIKSWLEGKESKKIIFVPNKLINIVV